MSDSADGRSVPRSSLTVASLVAGVGFCLKALLVICVPVRALAMTPWLSDDAFIYAAIARNLATGGGYSLDGQTPTAGAPLLWTWILALFHAGLSDDASIKAALLLGSALSALSAIVVFSIAWDYGGRITAWISLALSVFLAPVSLSAINGMETSLFTFLGLVVVWLHVSRWGRGLLRRSLLMPLASGIVQGLMFLTRADAIFIVLAVFITELRFARVDKLPSERRALGLLAIGFVICCLPSLAWNYHATGSVLPSNQVGRRMLAWEGVYGATGIVLGVIAYLKLVVFNCLRVYELVSISVGSFLLAALSLMVSLIRRERRDLVVLILAYVMPYCATLVLYQGYFPDVHGLRYLDLSIHLIVVPTAWFLATAFRGSIGPGWHRAMALGAITAVLIGSTWIEYRSMVITRTWSKGMRLVPVYTRAEVDEWWSFLDRVRLELKPGTVVAAKDFGRLAYFSEARVVDLVGIIDPSIVASRRDDAMAEFLRVRGVEYVVTPPRAGFHVHNEIRGNATLEPVAGFPQQEATGYLLHRVLY